MQLNVAPLVKFGRPQPKKTPRNPIRKNIPDDISLHPTSSCGTSVRPVGTSTTTKQSHNVHHITNAEEPAEGRCSPGMARHAIYWYGVTVVGDTIDEWHG